MNIIVGIMIHLSVEMRERVAVNAEEAGFFSSVLNLLGYTTVSLETHLMTLTS